MLINKHILDDKYIFELASIFKEKGWTIEQSTDDEYSIFDLFCDRLQSLKSDSDRDLIIELTKNYLVVDVDEYCKYLSKTLKIFFEEKKYLLDNLDTIHVFPVQDKDYIDKTKSGNIICYFLQGIVFRKFSVFRDKRVRIIETFNGLEKHKDEIEILMLVDDYVGSGDTVLGCINTVEEKGISKDKINVLALVLQECGKNAVEGYGVPIYASVIKNKAISDNYEHEEAEKKVEQMKKISKQIRVKDHNLYLGYKESEALVTMIKTPNNTLPFYWYEGKKDGNIMLAPFSRRNNVGVDT